VSRPSRPASRSVIEFQLLLLLLLLRQLVCNRYVRTPGGFAPIHSNTEQIDNNVAHHLHFTRFEATAT